MKLYKLTDANGLTHGNTQWGEGVSHSGTGEGELCGPGWIHAYSHPLLAALLKPIHANFVNPILWIAAGKPAEFDGELKLGCKTLTMVRQIKLPELTAEFRVMFAIRCALVVYKDPKFVSWANDWLSGQDRYQKSESESASAAW